MTEVGKWIEEKGGQWQMPRRRRRPLGEQVDKFTKMKSNMKYVVKVSNVCSRAPAGQLGDIVPSFCQGGRRPRDAVTVS